MLPDRRPSSARAPYTVAGSSVAALVRYAATRGVEARALLSGAGLSIEALEDPDERVPQGVYNRLFDDCARGCDDSDFGLHFAEGGALEGFHVLGHLVRRSATLGEAFARVARYSRIVHDAGRVEVESTRAGLEVFPGCRGLLHDYPRQVAEYAAASVVVIARAVTGQPLAPRRVDFRHPAPSSIVAHESLFACDLRFGQPDTRVVFDSQAAGAVVRESEPGLVSLLELLARGLLEKLGERDDLTARVERALARNLEEGPPDLDAVRRQLGMSRRTLQRELRKSDTSFQESRRLGPAPVRRTLPGWLPCVPARGGISARLLRAQKLPPRVSSLVWCHPRRVPNDAARGAVA